MIYRFIFIAFIGAISFLLISAKLSVETTKVANYNPIPPYSGGPGTGGLGDRTGSPVSSATCTQCHSGGSFGASVSVQVLSGATPVTSYTGGNTYTVIYTVTGSASGYGFQGGALTSTNAAGGAFSAPSANAQLVTISGRPYFEHDNGASATGVFQATWTAPTAFTGNVTFYGIGLAVNGNGGTSGDQVTTPISMTLTEDQPTTITYPGTPFCASEPNQTPVVTGEITGTYSSSTGLSINPSSGIIDVAASTPGTYSIDYTYSTGVTTFSVTIQPTFSSSTTATICDNETFAFGTQVLNQTNAGLNTETFQAVNGCDSTVQLTLTVLPTITGTDAATICSGDTYDFNGQILTDVNAGLNTAVLQSANGCDSTVSLTLTVLPIYTESEAVTICAGDTYDFNGQILTDANAGLNTAILQSANGCDSTVNLTLTVETIDNTVAQAGSLLTANQTGATYQWVDCDNANAAIAGETNASFTVTTTGNYAVEVTVNNCTETSACTLVDLLSIKELNINSAIVFPNPISDVFEIKNIEQFGTINSIHLMDATGKVVGLVPANTASMNIGYLEPGIYFLRIAGDSGESILQLVKK